MRLLDLREAAVAGLAAKLPELKEIKPHGGRFSGDSLKRFAMKAPAARVAWLGVSKMRRNNAGQFTGPAQMACYLVAKDAPGVECWTAVMELAETVAAAIELSQWGLDFVGPAQVQGIENLYDMEVDRQGIALAAVVWEQEVTFGRDIAVEDMAETFEGAMGSLSEIDWFGEGEVVETP